MRFWDLFRDWISEHAGPTEALPQVKKTKSHRMPCLPDVLDGSGVPKWGDFFEIPFAGYDLA
jgi:hypothetical protein